jgi:hypothetical protein
MKIPSIEISFPNAFFAAFSGTVCGITAYHFPNQADLFGAGLDHDLILDYTQDDRRSI